MERGEGRNALSRRIFVRLLSTEKTVSRRNLETVFSILFLKSSFVIDGTFVPARALFVPVFRAFRVKRHCQAEAVPRDGGALVHIPVHREETAS